MRRAYFSAVIVLYFFTQSSRDHPGSAVLWSHRHVVLGLCDSWTLPGMAPVPRRLGVRSGNTYTNAAPPCCILAFRQEGFVFTVGQCLRLWALRDSPVFLPTAPDDSCAALLFISTYVTEIVVQLVQPQCCRARHYGVTFLPSVNVCGKKNHKNI